MFTSKDQQLLMILTRATLVEAWETGNLLLLPEDLPETMLTPCGAFVSLHDDHLRGCIGFMEPIYPLIETLQRCVISAAFTNSYDQLTAREEVDGVDIEISILSPMYPYSYASVQELTEKLTEEKPGVLLSDGIRHAVYLPLVWDDLPNVETFLSQLCLKAGMAADRWRAGDLEISLFTAEVFRESELQAQA